MSQAIIELKNVSKKFDGDDVLNNISFTINRHEFVTLLGPSGCGKTTTLRIIGGFETPTAGKVLFEGSDLLSLPSHKRSINTVFQKYALFPHMNVYENIAFGLKVRKTDKSIIKGKVEEALKLVNLSGYERRNVEALSGGQQQRVAIARAIVNEPTVLLLDEPLGALDLKLRKEMQIELKRMQQRLGITFIYVTHDQEEALTMSDRIIVMNKGEIQQIGTPEDIYNEPQNAFVAGFIGDSNIVDGVMLEDFRVVFLGHEFECVDKGFAKNEAVDVVLRPEDVKLKPQNEGMIQGVVKSAIFKGVHYEMLVETQGATLIVHSTHLREPGTHVGISVVPFDIQIMKKVAP